MNLLLVSLALAAGKKKTPSPWEAPTLPTPPVTGWEEASVILEPAPVDPWEWPDADPQAIERFAQRRLAVVPVQGPAGPTWVLQDGRGNPLDTYQFATVVEDSTTLTALAAERRRSEVVAMSMAGVGGALMLGAIAPVMLIDWEKTPPDPDTYVAFRDDYTSDEAWIEAQEAQDKRYAIAKAEYQTTAGRNADMRWTALAMAGGGAMLIFAAPFVVEGQVEERREAANAYTQERAEALVNAYNAEIAAEEGLPPEGWSAPPVKPRRPEIHLAVAGGYVGVEGAF